MKRNLIFVIAVIIILAFFWLITSMAIQYNKSKVEHPAYYQFLQSQNDFSDINYQKHKSTNDFF